MVKVKRRVKGDSKKGSKKKDKQGRKNVDKQGRKNVKPKSDGVVQNAWSKKVPSFTKSDNPHCLLEESSFATLFPQYREIYLKQNWPEVTEILLKHGVKADLDLVEGSMTVRTTRQTWDPYIIMKARDMIKLLARSVPVRSAARVLLDDMSADIIKIGSMLRNKTKFIKRRQRLIGPDGATLKAIELLTDCYILVQGQTVAAIGPYKGLTAVRKVVTETINNIHPIYNIKAMMIKRELAKNPKMKNENWERFLPNFKSGNVNKRKQPMKKTPKKPYTPFPPAPTESKVDIALASGEYFLKPEQKQARKEKETAERHVVAKVARGERRNLAFVPPTEPDYGPSRSHQYDEVNVVALKRKLERSSKKRKPGDSQEKK